MKPIKEKIRGEGDDNQMGDREASISQSQPTKDERKKKMLQELLNFLTFRMNKSHH